MVVSFLFIFGGDGGVGGGFSVLIVLFLWLCFWRVLILLLFLDSRPADQ